MDEPWVKVFLRNGQFETAANKKKNTEDHLYTYLVNKYRNLFDIPISEPPRSKTLKPHPKNKSKTNTVREKSVEYPKKHGVENKSCSRCPVTNPYLPV